MSLYRAEVHAFVLRALLAADGTPMSDSVLREKLKARFGFLPSADLANYIRLLDESGHIAGTHNEFFGCIMWLLTDKGVIQAKQLP
jgi:hypothetical protein